MLSGYPAMSNKNNIFLVPQIKIYAGQLVTERALLDDNGDGLGTRADWFRGIRPVQKAEDGLK
jgi:hypothetical protein